MRFTLRQLEVFLAVAHHQSISRAADELVMSQSAVSGSLKELEQKHSAQLFDRVGKRLQLNELGARLRPSCEALLVQAAELEQEFTQQRRASEIRVGATLTVGNYLCVELIDRYRQRTGEGRVHLEVANTRHIVRELLDFNIDLGMIEGEVQHPDLDVIPWQSDELVCICAPAHHLAATGELGIDEIGEVAWILREPGSGTRQTFERALRGYLSQLNISLELQHTEAIKRAVQANMGVSCLSRIAVADALKRGDLVELAAPALDLHRQLYVILHRQKYLSAGLRTWLAVCGVAPR
ncbi:transcriptional regulator, LysR family [Teredinibacter turnerae T7901]|uniref:Transcriptional regulator, LysR family n=1 Tax=Teredinibacter turnerae (strain ATCC 39867 / T7901) TaxID=377629 RepID=C5BT44_TERTT|nr:LysR family transcriptional regulator [Teredinibacter turnerae]ACR13056.1 transcriptional regulator, LysR family [Teredinibacter turnerae T7901]